jgi:prephenate dehydratase
MDVTGDRAWVVADIPNIKVIATGSLISAAAANIDQLYLQLTDTTGNTTRISILQTGRSF